MVNSQRLEAVFKIIATSVTGNVSVVGNAFGSQFVSAPANGVYASGITGSNLARKLIEKGEYAELFEKNRRRFEAKWNMRWIPHQNGSLKFERTLR